MLQLFCLYLKSSEDIKLCWSHQTVGLFVKVYMSQTTITLKKLLQKGHLMGWSLYEFPSFQAKKRYFSNMMHYTIWKNLK